MKTLNKRVVMIVALMLVPTLLLAGCSLPSFSLGAGESDLSAGTLAAQSSAPAAAPPVAEAPVSQAPSNGDVLDALQDTLGQIYEEVNPSVVNIQVMGTASITLPQIPGMPDPGLPMPEQRGLGSGFVWDTEGHIVTNNHVVASAEEITVTFSDGTTVPAEVVGTDPHSDLAVIKVNLPADQLRPVQVADSTQIHVGQLAVAIGNPFGLEGTMTVGFVSALGRSLPVAEGNALAPTYTIPDIIQTDAPINPGNSGGVLVDDDGRLIGVPTAIESPVQANAGIGFAVPAAIVQRVVPALIRDGAYEHPWLGISGTSLTPDLAEAMDLESGQRGALVIEVVDGSPADSAGLQGSDRLVELDGQEVQVGGDLITAIDGEPVNEFEDLVTYLTRSTSVGDTVELTILRGGGQATLKLVLAARPGDGAPQARSDQGGANGAWLGIQGLTITPEIAEAMDLSAEQEGVLVVQVVQDSPADSAGLRGSFRTIDVNGESLQVGGDVIVALDSQSVRGMEDLQTILRQAEPGQEVMLTVLRDGRQVDVEVTLGERPTLMP